MLRQPIARSLVSIDFFWGKFLGSKVNLRPEFSDYIGILEKLKQCPGIDESNLSLNSNSMSWINSKSIRSVKNGIPQNGIDFF